MPEQLLPFFEKFGHWKGSFSPSMRWRIPGGLRDDTGPISLQTPTLPANRLTSAVFRWRDGQRLDALPQRHHRGREVSAQFPS